jgi:hypothetical protein
MDFERKPANTPLALLRHSDWINHDEDALNLSRELNNPISGNNSIRVDVNPVDRTSWSVLSTDYIPITDDSYYEFSMDIRGKNVDNFHVRAQYYDSNKTRIDREIIYDSSRDSFDDKFAASIIPPESTGFLRFEVLVAPDYSRHGNYIIDNANVDEVIPNRTLTLASDESQDKPMKSAALIGTVDNRSSIAHALNKSDAARYKIPVMDSVALDENRLYNYTANIRTDDADSLVGLLTFRSSDDVVKNSTKYGAQASHGSVLSLAPNSEIYTEVDIN